MASISLMFVILLLMLVVVFVFVAVRLSRRGTVSVPVCGKCSYAVQGLPTFTCPECGSDLREVGIVTPTTRRPLPPLALAIIWTLILPVPALVISVAAVAMVPQVQETSAKVSFTGPPSRAYDSLDLEIRGRRTVGGAGVAPYELVFTLAMPAGSTGGLKTTTMKVDVISSRSTYIDSAGKTVEATTGLSAEILADWMATAGVDVKAPKVQLEIADFVTTARTAGSGTSQRIALLTFGSRGVSSASSSGPPRWLLPSLAGFWLLVWILGILRIFRKPKSARA